MYCISKNFYEKGFKTPNVLTIRDNSPLNTIISIVLSHISHRKNFDEKDCDTILNQLKSCNVLKKIKNLQKIKNFGTIKEKLSSNEGNEDLILLASYMRKVKRSNGEPLGSMDANEVASLLPKLRPYIVSQNKKKLNFYRL